MRFIFRKQLNYFLIAVLSCILFSAGALAMTCSPLEDATHQGCIEIKEQQYNTTTPIINITFKESVEVKNYQLYKIGELGAEYPDDLFDSDNYEEYVAVSLNSPIVISEDSLKMYSYSPINHIPDGVYLFRINAFNVPNVNIDVAVLFSINGTMMNIWVTQPENDLVDASEHPNFAVSNNSTFDIEMETERNLEREDAGCRFYPNNIPSTVTLANAYRLAPFEFDNYENDARKVIFADFNMSEYWNNYGYNGDLRTIFVVCKETGERYSYGEILVGVDTSEPSIKVSSKPEPLVDYFNRVTNITIETDDKSACTIEGINMGKNDQLGPRTYPYPIINRTPNYDFTRIDEFMKKYEERLLYSSYPNPSVYEYKITCKNLANLESTKYYNVSVDLQIIQSFEFYSPSNSVNSTAVFINGSANIGEGVTCTASINSTSYFNLTKISNTFVEGRQVFSGSINVQTDGTYTVSVNCTYMYDSFSTRTFKVDRTPPPAPNITGNDKSCSLSKITAKAESKDNLSGIYRYYYNLTLKDGEIDDSREGSTSSGSISINIDGDTVEGKTYTLRVSAEDNAGNRGATSSKDIKVTNNTIVECDEVSPRIFVNEERNQETNTLTIKVNCTDSGSGCRSFFAYGLETNASKKCNATQTLTLMTPVIISNSGTFCAKVFDNNNNEADYKKEYIVNYPVYCFNGIKDGKETDTDCGGECKKCDFAKNCIIDFDCMSNYCFNNKCAQPTCTDLTKNGNESGIDCGGECQGCGVGAVCNSDKDCLSLNCLSGRCAEASCNDTKKDGKESDADCGGDCPQCARGSKCNSAFDCTTAYCEPVTNVCQINPSLDTDKDKLPDVWEEKYCGSFTGCDPKVDLDGDEYTNLEEFLSGTNPLDPSSYPDYKKYNIFAVILLILGILLTGAGITIKVLESLEEERRHKQREELEMQSTLGQIPRMASIETQPVRQLTEEEKKLRMQAREKALRARDAERRKVMTQFDNGEELKPQTATQQIFNETPLRKEESQEKKTKSSEEKEEYLELSALNKGKENDPFSKLKKITEEKTSKKSQPAQATSKKSSQVQDVKTQKSRTLQTSSSAKSKEGKSEKADEVFDKLKKITKAKKNK